MAGYDLLAKGIDEELRRFLDADPRQKKDVVETALWREFGGETQAAIDLRMEQKERRIQTVEKEISELEQELAEHTADLQALEQKREELKTPEEEYEEDLTALLSQLEDGEHDRLLPAMTPVQEIANDHREEPDDVHGDLKALAAKQDRRIFNTQFMTPREADEVNIMDKELVADAYAGECE